MPVDVATQFAERTESAVEWLLESEEPAIRHLAKRALLGESVPDPLELIRGPLVGGRLAGWRVSVVIPMLSGAGPGIASVVGDRVILDGTTIEEVEKCHASTLSLVVERVNADTAIIEERERSRRDAEDVGRKEHEERVREVSERIRFE